MPTAQPQLTTVTWRKSSYSNESGGACLEVADGHPTAVPVRDSKILSGPALQFANDTWRAFVLAIRDDHFPA